MKIGILTTHSALNCGAVLQAFAMQTHLRGAGHSVEFINYQRPRGKQTVRSFVAKSFRKTYYKLVDRLNEYIYKRKGDFGDILTRGSQVYRNLSELQSSPPDYDVYIAGSDQIWNVSSNNTINSVFYLDFGTDGVRRVSYAASMGQCNVPDFLDNKIRSLVQRFDGLSLREVKGVRYIASLVGNGKQVYHVPDPTFLISLAEYEKVLLPNPKTGSKFMASYILAELGNRQLQAVKFIKKQKGLDIVNLRNPDTCIRLDGSENTIVKPLEWLTYMYYSEFNICCSFHAVVFSLIFHKPFIVITPYPNERISSLLGQVNLLDRIIMDYDQNYINELLSKDIDWSIVDETLVSEAGKGREYLRTKLED